MDANLSMDPVPSPSPFDRASKSPLPVLIGGLVTGILALAVVWLIAGASDFNLMTWYLWYVVPAGAVVVGLVAGSGYGIASWATGTKISKGLLVAVLALQVACYFGAIVIEYRQAVEQFDLEGVSFFSFFDLTTKSFAFIGDDGNVGNALGAWGYVFRLLEIAGFAVGGLIVPLAMGSKPFCEGCQVYMKSRPVTFLRAGVAPRKFKKKDVEGQQESAAEANEAFTSGMETLKALCGHAEAGRLDAFQEIVDGVAGEQKEIQKLTARITVTAHVCPRCHSGYLQADLLSGQGDHLATEHIGNTPIQPDTGRTLMDRSRRAA